MQAFSPNNPEIPVLNDSAAITSNLDEISTSISTILSESMTELLAQIDTDFASSGADQKEIINPYENSPNYNANSFVSQYCASKDTDFESVSLSDMEDLLRQNKDKLYAYSRSIEERTATVETITVNAETGEETVIETEITETWAVYTITYNGETYFADNVFHLSEDQKTLADNYTQNMSTFLGDSMFQRLPAGYETIATLGNIRFTDGQTEVVYFNQLDERYADKPYGTDYIGGYACGPTSMAIVISSLTNDTVDPIKMAQWAYENGYWCSGSGSYHSLIPGAAEAWGLPVEGCGSSEGQKIVDALSNSKLVVALMDEGHFANSGHFIVLRGIRNGKVLVADPASYERSEQEWELSVILNEASTGAGAGGPFWIIG